MLCQEDIAINMDKLRMILKKVPNWKSPNPGILLKNFKSVHERLVEQLNPCLEAGKVPLWMTNGRTLCSSRK